MATERPRKVIRFDELTPLGRVVWLAGATAHWGVRLVSTSVREAGRLARESKEAFREGLHGSQKDRSGPRL